jgi:NAD(P)-dependent dehydrogenase (short-subunit alcohol dehydrogenase family)
MKNYVIAGGTKGIGAKITARILENGDRCYVYAREQHDLADHNNIIFNSIDFTLSGDGLPNLPEQIDGLIYCPGSINLAPFHRIKLSAFEDEFRLNVMGAIKCIQACLPGLKKSESPSVVLFSTVAVQTGMPFHSSISSAKGAIEGLTRSLAAEYASSGIRFNALAPSLTDTPLAAKLLSSPEKREASAKRHPLGRFATTDDIAAAALFLVGKESSFVSGQVWGVDGGIGNLRMV